ncbi:MAG: hypothetical protein ACREF9_19580 [Opitutaceae bacterium]
MHPEREELSRRLADGLTIDRITATQRNRGELFRLEIIGEKNVHVRQHRLHDRLEPVARFTHAVERSLKAGRLRGLQDITRTRSSAFELIATIEPQRIAETPGRIRGP